MYELSQSFDLKIRTRFCNDSLYFYFRDFSIVCFLILTQVSILYRDN